MADTEVKIIGSKNSLFCTRIEWALKLKGVEYEYIHEDLTNKSELLLKSNPVHKKVPVLLHDGAAIPESLVILEYIDEKWKDTHPLLPCDPCERAQARFWATFADEKVLFGAWRAYKAEGEEKEKEIEATLEAISYLEKQIESDKRFFGGDQIGYLDLVLGWIVLWLGVMEEVGGMKLLEAHKFPALHEWTHSFIQIPSFKECLPPREDVVSYSSSYLLYVAANKS